MLTADLKRWRGSDHRLPLRRGTHALDLALLLGQLVLVACLTWGTWPDVLIDFGRELYVPARLSGGAVLYRDLAYFNGPLSPYGNALLFRLFGASLATLVFANAVILAATIILGYLMLYRLAGRTSAVLALSLFLWTCTGAQYLDVANYNWFAPYSHEMTHGFFLGLGSLAAADRARRRDSLPWWFAAGLLCGMTMLTKCELGLAAVAANAVELVASLRNGQSAGWRIHCLVAWHAAAAIPPIAAVFLLARAIPLDQAVAGTLGSWKYLTNSALASSPYYRAVMGTDDWLLSLQLIYGWGAVYALLLLLGAWFDRGLPNGCGGPQSWFELSPMSHANAPAARALRWLGPTATALAGGAVLACVHDRLDWLSMPRPWPIVVLLLIGASLVQLPARSLTTQQWNAQVLRGALSLFALVLVLKIILYVRVFHYGFVLSVPALWLTVCAGWEWWPRWMDRKRGALWGSRAAFLVLAGAFVVSHAAIAARYLREHTIPIGSGNSRFMADQRGELVRRLLSDVSRYVAPHETLLCLPEGVMMNFLSGRTAPTRHINFVPGDVLLFGEQAMLDDLQSSPPDWIVLISRDTTEYGVPHFTRDYGRGIGEWIDVNYRMVVRYGARPFFESGPGYELLRRTTN